MDLVKLGHDLVKDIPELNNTFFSLSASFGKLVFATRMERKLTQSQLADLANEGVKTIHRIEGGSGGITDTTYEKVFHALKITNEDLEEVLKKTPLKQEN